jgi:predicted deacylase
MTHQVDIESFHPHELRFVTFGEPGQGPRVLVTAGIHGGEASGIWAARKLEQWLPTQALKGQVTVLPVANPAAFRNLTRTSPFDQLDLNRIFPGKPEGSPSMVVASRIWEQAKQADLIIDLHCCGLFGSDYTLALWQQFGFAKELAGKIDIPVVIQSGGTRSQLFVEACHAGIPAVIIELAGGQLGAGGGILDRRSGENAFTAVTNLLRRLGLAQGEAPAIAPAFYGPLQEVHSLRAALWSPVVAPGARVEEGQLLGDLEGEQLFAPVTGVATSVRGDSYVFPGYTVAMVGPLLEG